MIARTTRHWWPLLSALAVTALLVLVGLLALFPSPDAAGAAHLHRPMQQEPPDVCGTVVTNTLWSAAVGQYRASCSVRVSEGVRLTIEPGVEVRFAENASLQIAGAMTVAGGQQGDVVFTSDKPETARGDWPGVVIDRNATASVNGLTIRYAGRGTNPALQVRATDTVLENLAIEDTAAEGLRIDGVNVTVRGSRIERSSQHAIRTRQGPDIIALVRLESVTLRDNDGDAVRSDANVQFVQSDITAQNNKTNGIVVQSGTVNLPLTWQAHELPIVPDGTVIVNAGITITAGSAVKASPTGSLTVRGGTFHVNGTAERPVVFTALSDDTTCTAPNVSCDTNNDGAATTPDRGSWRYVDLVSTSGPSSVSHAEFRFGTGPVLWIRTAGVTVANTVFTRSRDHGAKVENVSASFVNCRFAGSRNPDRRDAAGLLLDNTSPNSITVQLRGNTFADNDIAVSLRNPNISLQNEGNSTDFTNGVNGYRITGRQTTPQTWRAGDLPFVVTGRLELAETAAVLVLEPGLTVKMEQRSTIEAVRGLLRSGVANGDRVLITSFADDACSADIDAGCDTNGDGGLRQPAPGDWGAVIIRGGGGFVRRTVLRYGGDSPSYSQLDLQATENTAVEDSEFWYSSNAGLRVFQVNSTLTRNLFAENRDAGIKLVAGSAAVVVTLEANTFDKNGGCAVDMEANVELVMEGDNQANANARNGLCVAGDSRVSRTWKKGSLPYLVTGSVNVVGESRLTIEPGAVIKFLGQAGISVAERSSLMARGTSDNRIVFTSLKDDRHGGDSNPADGPAEPNAGDWNGLKFDTTASQREESVLAHALVLYAGRQAQPAVQVSIGNARVEHVEVRDGASVGIRVDNVSPSITDNVIVNQRGAGIEIRTRAEPLQPVIQRNNISGCAVAMAMDANVEPQLQDNEATDNMLNGISVKGAMTVGRKWTAGDLPYLLEGRVLVSRGGTLRIEAGTLVKALQGAALSVDYGALEVPVEGSGDDPVTLTSIRDDTCGALDGTCDTNNDGTATRPVPGDWEGIILASTARAAAMKGFHVAYGGSRNANIVIEKELVRLEDSVIAHAYTDGVYVSDARVTISRNLFHGNLRNGLQLRNAASATIDGNIFTENGRSIEHRASGNTVTSNNVAIGNTEDAMLFCAAVNTTQSWTNDLDRDIACLINVTGATLSLDPGLVLRFSDREGINITSELQAEGVTFTSISDSGDYGVWRGLRFETNSRGGHIRHSRFLYGGYGQQGTVDSQSQGALDVSFNVFRRIENIAVSARKQSPMTIRGNLFRDLGGDRGGAVRVEDRGTNPAVEYNRFVSVSSGVLANVDAQPIVRGNSFAGSSHGVVNRDLDVCVDGQQNWWGSITGPTDRSIANNDACRLRDNPGGTGVRVSDHVNYTNWLRQAPPLVPMVHGPRCGVTSNPQQEAYGETTPRAMVHVYDGAAPDPTVPIGSIEADDLGEFRIALNLSPGPHKLSFEAVKDGMRSPVSGFRVLQVADSSVDPMGIRFEYGTGGTRRVQPLRDGSGCATACGHQTSGRVTLPVGVPVRVHAPVEGSPAAVEFVQTGQPARPMQYDGATRTYVTQPFEPVQGSFAIRVSGAGATSCTGFVYLGGQGVVFQDVGASGPPPMTPQGDPFDFDFESGPAGWTGSSPWALVTDNYYSPVHSWHDSPNGNYPPRASLDLRAPGPIDLRTVPSPELRFWHIYRFARGDSGTVEYRLSATGSWNVLQRYRDTIGAWRGDVISLDRFANEPTFYLRFLLSSDAMYEDDGWYIDDVAILPGGALNRRYDQGEPVVQGAEVRLEQLNLDTGEWVRWNAAPSDQLNPQTTDAEGRYEFYYLEPGEYQVVVAAGPGGGVYRSPSQIVWDGTLGINAALQPTKPTYLPAVLKKRPLGR